MGAYQSSPKTETEPLDIANELMSCGANAMQGWRQSQEDAHNVILNFADDSRKALFAVYDGHGGAEVAKYCAEKFPDFLKKHELFSDGNFETCLVKAFLEFDSMLVQPDVLEELKRLAESSGDTSDQKGLLSLIKKKWVNMQNGGDNVGLEGEDSSSEEDTNMDSDEDEDIAADGEEISVDQLLAEAHAPIDTVLEKISSKSPRKIEFVGSSSTSPSGAGSSSAGCSSSSSSSAAAAGSSSSSSAGSSKALAIYEEDELVVKKVEDADVKDEAKTVKPEGTNNIDAHKKEEVEVAEEKEKGGEESKLHEKANDAEAKTGDSKPVVKIGENGEGEGVREVKKHIEENGDVPVVKKDSPAKKEEPAKENGVVNGGSPDSSSPPAPSQSNGASPMKPLVNGAEKPDPKGKAPLRPAPGMMGIVQKRPSAKLLPEEAADAMYEQLFADDLADEEDSDSDDTFEVEEEHGEDEDEDVEEEEEAEEDGESSAESAESDSGEEEEAGEDDEDAEEECEEEEEPETGGFLEQMGLATERETPGQASGCTAVVALVCDKRLFVANAGDSRCVLCRKGAAVDLSVDHKPEDAAEFTRIRNAGGVVTPDGRVCGGLNLSRSFGDHSYKQNKDLPPSKQMITADPDIRSTELTDDDEFLVLACDGIWNSMSSEEVVQFVRSRLHASPKPALSDICRQMFMHCLAGNTEGDGTGCDNMTAIIVELKHDESSGAGATAEPATAATATKRLLDQDGGADDNAEEKQEAENAKRIKIDE